MNISGLKIDDSTTRLFALARLVAIIEAFDEGRFEELEAMLGDDAAAIVDRMRKTTLSEAVALSGMRQLHALLVIDPFSLKSCLYTLESMQEDQRVFEYFVKHQASPALLAELFKRSPHQIKVYRKFFGVGTRGRPRMPDDAMRDAICESWNELGSSGATLRERYHQLHQEFPACTFLQLEAVLAAYESLV